MTVDPGEIIDSDCRKWDGAPPYPGVTIVRSECGSEYSG